MTVLPPPSARFPIDAVLPGLFDTLRQHGGAVLRAPPGAGKTLRVPTALLEQPWLPGHHILMVVPHGLAARATCLRMAALLREEPGQTVGFRTVSNSLSGPRTRIELLPATLFLRLIQDQPELADVGAVLFASVDRPYAGDPASEFTSEFPGAAVLGAAFAREAREALCGRTLLLAMAERSDGAAMAALLGGGGAPVPVVTGAGTGFPVAVHLRDAGGGDADAAAAIRHTLREERGGMLAFLPDDGTIHRIAALLEDTEGIGPDILLIPLCDEAGEGSLAAAIAPTPPGLRKLVLATPFAEAGLGIADIRIVVDCGLTRRPGGDRARGLARPVTVPAGQDAEDRRAAAAGRQEAGVCYRLRPPPGRPDSMPPDLAALVLEMAAWGITDPATAPWPVPPANAPSAAALAHAISRAASLLARLGATGADGAITPLGERMVWLGLHPRLGRLILCGADLGLGGLACTLAALLLEEAGPGEAAGDCGGAALQDMAARLIDEEQGRGEGSYPGMDMHRTWRILERAQAWRRRIGIHHPVERSDCARVGELLALAYPDRIALADPPSEPEFQGDAER
jgi:ATP-dependent helicase HrpB